MNTLTITRSDHSVGNADPEWLQRELRSDHAGEYGAVAIYQAILALSRDPEIREFARRHMHTEIRHLGVVARLVPVRQRSRRLPLWRLAAWATGGIPSLYGPRAVYATIQSVETFVDRHYSSQIDRLEAERPDSGLIPVLSSLRDDEIAHRDEAAALFQETARSLPLSIWCGLVERGSAIAVNLARRC